MSDVDDWENADNTNDLENAIGNNEIDPWAGEDDESDDEVLAGDWDMDEDEKAALKAAKEAQTVIKPKALSKKKLAAKMKKLEEDERRRLASMTIEDKYAEKARLQKAVEEEDHKLAEELFMGSADLAKVKPVAATNDSVEDVELSEEEDYMKFAEKIGVKVATAADGNRDFIVTFLKQVVTVASEELNLDTLNKVKHAVNALCNEKRKNETNKKKKGGKKKKYLNTGADGGKAGVNDASLYDDYADDFDFI